MRAPVLLRAAVVTLALSLAAIAPGGVARADVPFYKVFLTYGVEVDGQDRFPDWIVLVFPGGPNSGRPVAWPSLVEPGYQTAIDRKTLGTPRLWILPRAALDELAAAARENDDQIEGPVADLLKAKGVDCGKIPIEDSANLPLTAPDKRLLSYRLEEAAAGRCTMKQVREETIEEFKRPPSWARFAPRRKPDAGTRGAPSAAGSSAGSAAASAGPVASGPGAAATGPGAAASGAPGAASAGTSAASAASSAPAASSASAAREPQVPVAEKGCACSAAGTGGERAWMVDALVAAAAVGALGSRRRSGPRRPRRGASASGRS